MSNPNPPRDPNVPRPIDEAREQRDANARAQRTQDIRAQALDLAVRSWQIGAPVAEVFDAADDFAAYIIDGTKPVEPPPPVPPAR